MRLRFKSLVHFLRFRRAWQNLTETSPDFVSSAERDDMCKRLHRHTWYDGCTRSRQFPGTLFKKETKIKCPNRFEQPSAD